MAYFAPYIDGTGIHMPTYEERLAYLSDEYRTIFGEEAELSAAVPVTVPYTSGPLLNMNESSLPRHKALLPIPQRIHGRTTLYRIFLFYQNIRTTSSIFPVKQTH